MMFIPHRFVSKAATTSEHDSASDTKLPLFEDAEKASHLTGFVRAAPLKSWAERRKLPFVIKLLVLTLALAFTLLSGRSIIDYATLGYNAIVQSNKSPGHVACDHEASVEMPIAGAAAPVTTEPILAKVVDRKDTKVHCSSGSGSCDNAIDGNAVTYWRSDAGTGHTITVELKTPQYVHSLQMTPGAEWEKGGTVTQHRIEVAMEEGKWEPVALGTWRDWGQHGRHTHS